jgi:ribose transport system substrate-binding protein
MAGRVAAISAVIGLTLAVAACSSSGSSTSASSTAAATTGGGGASTQASACTSKATGLVQAESKTTPFLVGPSYTISSLKGKYFAWVGDDLAVNTDQEQFAAVQQAAAAAGVVVKSFDGGGTVTGYAQAMTEAIASHPVGIMIHAIEPQLISAQLQAAKSAGIAIEFSETTQGPNYPYYSNVDFGQEGRDMADYALMTTKCAVHGYMLYTASFATVTDIYNGVKNELSSLCGSSCTLGSGNIEISALATATGPATTSALQRNPNLNIMFAGYDALANFMIPAIQAAPKKLPLVSSSAVTDNITKYVATGNTEVADVSAGLNAAFGWADLDQVMREVLKQKPSPTDTSLPLQLVTASNAAAAVTYPSYTGYQSKFEASWGVS